MMWDRSVPVLCRGTIGTEHSMGYNEGFRLFVMKSTQLCAGVSSITSTPNPSNNVKLSQSIIEIRLTLRENMAKPDIKASAIEISTSTCRKSGTFEKSLWRALNKASALRCFRSIGWTLFCGFWCFMTFLETNHDTSFPKCLLFSALFLINWNFFWKVH